MGSLIRKPSAWFPIAMPFGIMAMILYHLMIVGIVREADEGLAAHVFQLWLVVQVLAMIYFAIQWLPEMPRQALLVLALQLLAAIIAAAPVFILEL